MTEREFLERHEAAEYLTARGLRTTRNTLQKLACIGGGPVYQRYGIRAVYRRCDLDAWIDQKLSPPRASSARRAAG